MVETSLENPNSTEFRSVLTQPFHEWNAIEEIFAFEIVQWTSFERSKIIESLIRFLELKVLMEEYTRKDQLLTPTELIERAWFVLARHKTLYRQTITSIQDFHGRSRHLIHCSVKKRRTYECDDIKKIERTQSLFVCYYSEVMPAFLCEIDGGMIDNTDFSSCADNSMLDSRSPFTSEITYRYNLLFLWLEKAFGRIDSHLTCCKIDDDAFTVATASITDIETVKLGKSSSVLLKSNDEYSEMAYSKPFDEKSKLPEEGKASSKGLRIVTDLLMSTLPSGIVNDKVCNIVTVQY